MIIILESASISIAVVVIFYVVVIIDGKGDMALGTRLSGVFFNLLKNSPVFFGIFNRANSNEVTRFPPFPMDNSIVANILHHFDRKTFQS